ncbi:MAG: DNA gyrase inhibitor YacG [Deltaproteobacteria bacterium]|nr:DNA gyrase inhibitor YacG [Deltaproteobacteria bacterium]
MNEPHPHPTCPTCRKPVREPRGPPRPFCSARCKLVDLQKWLGGAFAIPGEPSDEPSDEPEGAASDSERGGSER